MPRSHIGPTVSAAILALIPLQASTASPYPYKLEITPMEGPLNPDVERRYTPQFQSCQKKAISTLENLDCLEAEFARQDADLNRVWRTTIKRVPSARREALLEAERKWVADRDPFCESHAEALSLGGSIRPILYLSCRTELTIRRTIWLENVH